MNSTHLDPQSRVDCASSFHKPNSVNSLSRTIKSSNENPHLRICSDHFLTLILQACFMMNVKKIHTRLQKSVCQSINTSQIFGRANLLNDLEHDVSTIGETIIFIQLFKASRNFPNFRSKWGTRSSTGAGTGGPDPVQLLAEPIV